mmetsp:Transcript_112773/g.318813  ORF Transcript_112773/g.318813 Transcript_112773/m.318813 type:complete len:202 (+) Transcript_112773:722-1327(+)
MLIFGHDRRPNHCQGSGADSVTGFEFLRRPRRSQRRAAESFAASRRTGTPSHGAQRCPVRAPKRALPSSSKRRSMRSSLRNSPREKVLPPHGEREHRHGRGGRAERPWNTHYMCWPRRRIVASDAQLQPSRLCNESTTLQALLPTSLVLQFEGLAKLTPTQRRKRRAVGQAEPPGDLRDERVEADGDGQHAEARDAAPLHA